MRSYVPEFEMKSPRSLAEGLEWMAREPGQWTPFAGGTDLMVLFESGKLVSRRFINLWGLRELCGIEAAEGWVRLGALTTYSQLQADPVMRREFPILCQSSFETGAVAIQNRGTLGGNIANASPAADSSPGLLAYEAQVELICVEGSRWLDYASFHTGYKQTARRPSELIRSIRLPRDRTRRSHYWRKVGTRKAQAISKVALAAVALAKGQIRVALGSVGPVALRAYQTETAVTAYLLGRSRANRDELCAVGGRQLDAEITPIDDIRSTALYRRKVAVRLLEDFLRHVELGK